MTEHEMDRAERVTGKHFRTAPAQAPAGAPRPARRATPAPRPDETAVFLEAARHRSTRRAPAPDETAVFLAAAERSRRDGAPLEPAPLDPAPAPAPVTPGGRYASTASPDDTFSFIAAFSRRDDDAGPDGGEPEGAPEPPMEHGAALPAEDDDEEMSGAGDYGSVARSAGLMTLLIIISRITGFIRTWVMGIAFGVSFVASSYNIANNLPNMLYELVMGGMLVTAFLPVYLEARRSGGREGADRYVGNLLSILLVLLGAASILAAVFSPFLIWTQSFMSSAEEMDTAVWLFRIFAVQILFYGLGSVFSGVLNAHRDYFWSNFAPVLNNVIVIIGFALYPVLEPLSAQLALTVVAICTTAGVFVQMACQIPALARHDVHPRLHIDLRDPMLLRTVSLGVPTLVVTVCTLVTVSVQNAAALAVEPEVGASIVAYARLWYTLPYALIAASLNTAIYTELARDVAAGRLDSVRSGVSGGIAQQLFLLIPFAFYLIVFSFPLNMVYCSGKFDLEGVSRVSEFLSFMAPSLPLYAVTMLMQKACSALRDMRAYALMIVLGGVAEIAIAMGAGVYAGGGMPWIALSYLASYAVSTVGALLWLRSRLHGIHLATIARGVAFGIGLGALGAVAGEAVLSALETFVAPLIVYLPSGGATTASIVQTVAYVAIGGIVSLAVTFGPAVLLDVPEARMLTSLFKRLVRR